MTVATRTAMQTSLRAAAIELLEDFAADAGINLQTYPGRPKSIYPPCAFVNTVNDSLQYSGLRVRVTTAEIIVIHGLFDTGDTTAQKDAFMDAFLDWVTDNPHVTNADAIGLVTATDDDPNFIPDWMPPEEQRSYYATRIILEGHTQGRGTMV